MAKKTTPADYHGFGFIDGRNGNPKRKDLRGLNERAYRAGYAEGSKERSEGQPPIIARLIKP
jgi:hypothetical protein